MPTRILLAESDDVLRASLAEQLEQEGYDVMPASNIEEACTVARENLSFAIIGLSDGEQLAIQLREQGLSCPLLLLTDGEAPSAQGQGRRSAHRAHRELTPADPAHGASRDARMIPSRPCP